MNKQRTTYLAVTALAIVGYMLTAAFFSSPVRKLESDVRTLSQKLAEDRTTLKQKPALEAEWQGQKSELEPGTEADAMLNAWVKDLLAYAQSQSLVLEKLEPAGVKTDSGFKRATVFVSFHGDIRSLITYVYELMDRDAYSSVDSFGMRREEEAQTYAFELVLGKAVR